jgi:hypothetical protein
LDIPKGDRKLNRVVRSVERSVERSMVPPTRFRRREREPSNGPERELGSERQMEIQAPTKGLNRRAGPLCFSFPRGREPANAEKGTNKRFFPIGPSRSSGRRSKSGIILNHPESPEIIRNGSPVPEASSLPMTSFPGWDSRIRSFSAPTTRFGVFRPRGAGGSPEIPPAKKLFGSSRF